MNLKNLVKLTLLLSIITISSLTAVTLNITETPSLDFSNFGFEARESNSSLHVLSFEISSDSLTGFYITLESTYQGKLMRNNSPSTKLGNYCLYGAYIKAADPQVGGSIGTSPDFSKSNSAEVTRLLDYLTVHGFGTTIGYLFDQSGLPSGEQYPLHIQYLPQTSPNYTLAYKYELYISLPINYYLFQGNYTDTITLKLTDGDYELSSNSSTVPASSTAYFDLQLSNQKLSLKLRKNKAIIAQKQQ